MRRYQSTVLVTTSSASPGVWYQTVAHSTAYQTLPDGSAPESEARAIGAEVGDCVIARLRDRALSAVIAAQRNDLGDTRSIVGTLEGRARRGELLRRIGTRLCHGEPGLGEQPVALLVRRLVGRHVARRPGERVQF